MESEKRHSIHSTVADRLFKSRIVMINGEITQQLVGQVTSQLIALSSISSESITLFIHSQGGHVESGDSIHDIIRFIDAKVRIVGSGGWPAPGL